MTVVLVAPACPLPFGDTAAKWTDVLIRELVRRGHRVRLVCVTDEPEARLVQSRLRLDDLPGQRFDASFHSPAAAGPAFWRRARSLRRPFSEIEQASGVRRAVEARLADGYDVLHLEHLWTGWIGEGIPRSLLNVHHLEVIDTAGERPRSLGRAKTLWQMRRATAAVLRRTQNARFFSSRLSDTARPYNPRARHWVLPFALDAAHYEPVAVPSAPVVGLIGSMHWPPSRAAAERLITRIWPRVRARVPAATLLVAGWNAARHLGALASTPGLELRSDLGHPRDFFSSVSVLAYPLPHGSGMKIKVMEAMAFGVPVVTSPEGVEGLAIEPGVHAWVAGSDDAAADGIVELLGNHAAAARMRQAARGLVLDEYNPRRVVGRLLEIYGEVAA